MTVARALTIAGSDSGGGAGIQADLKTFSALGVYGMSAIAALTAQNTVAVTGIFDVEPDFVAAQIDAVMMDIGADAVKIGMLGQAEVIEVVARRLRHWKPRWVVVDPVMVAKSGDKLLRDDAVEALRCELLPLASVITPNLPEAAVLLDAREVDDRLSMVKAARGLVDLGASAVLLKGGHLPGRECPDLLFDGRDEHWFETARHDTRNTHGTGCTLSSAIAANLALGRSLPEAVAAAKAYIGAAIRAADRLDIGKGHGPVHHFHRLWPGTGGDAP
ncbi:MAG: bifunctional hydroxymethylpyrimidine kinase/phosphomethylpyrimidine kinase [Geminicoccaceae bacterium]|nr:bifunctional hydroxymethylpyrimidine kinase/phosphomethylpyrimidine kinase [Geminicoccaceae bacterium]